MADSELLATIATGSINAYFQKNYTGPDKYREDYFKDELESLENISDDDLMEYEQHRIVNPPQISKLFRWNFSLKDSMIWDIWIEIEILDHNYSISDLLHMIDFVIGLNGEEIHIPIVVNCFMAQLMNRKIVETDTGIMIPIELPTILRMKKIPIHRSNTYIGMYLFCSYSVGEQILYFKSCESKPALFPENCLSLTDKGHISWCKRFHIFEGYQLHPSAKNKNISFIGFAHFLIFDTNYLLQSIEKEEAMLEEIHLSLNGMSPIVYKSMFDEIITFTIYGKKFYAISLCPEFKNLNNIKCNLQNNKFLREITGINFNRIHQTEINLIFDTITLVSNDCIIYQISSNILQKINDLMGVVYTN